MDYAAGSYITYHLAFGHGGTPQQPVLAPPPVVSAAEGSRDVGSSDSFRGRRWYASMDTQTRWGLVVRLSVPTAHNAETRPLGDGARLRHRLGQG